MLRFEILGHAQGMDFFYNFTQVTILRTGISAILFVVLICKLNSRVVLFSKNVTDGLGQEMRALQRGCKVMSKENDKLQVASMVSFPFQMYVLED